MSKLNISYFLKGVILLQIITLNSIVLTALGLNIPYVREFFSLLYILFVPGSLMLGFVLNQRDNLRSFVFSVGLSSALLIFVGFITNLVGPLINISQPLTVQFVLPPIFLISFILTLLLCLTKPNYEPFSFGHEALICHKFPLTVVVLLLPFISIIGAYSLVFLKNNTILLLMIIFISLIPLFICSNKLPPSYYPLSIFSIVLALLYHNSLASPYIQGSDLHSEYYYANQVLMNHNWDMTISASHNTVLSDVILAPILSICCDISLSCVFKVIFPLLFSIGCLALYLIYRDQVDSKSAFFASFFFVSIFIVYTELLQLAKQMIAEFFLILLLLALFSPGLSKTGRWALSMVFMLSIIVSHYALTYMFVFILVSSGLIIAINRQIPSYKIFNFKQLPITFIIFAIISTVCWYIYSASSSAFNSVVSVGNHFWREIGSLFATDVSGGMYWLVVKLSMTEQILRYLYLIASALMALGLLYVIATRIIGTRTIFSDAYVLLAFGAMEWLVVGLVFPSLVAVGSIGFSRVFQICSILMSPFLIVGGLFFYDSSKNITNKWITPSKETKLSIPDIKWFIAIFLAFFLLLNTSLIAEVMLEAGLEEHAVSPSISQIRILTDGDQREQITLLSYNYPEYDIRGAEWLGKYSDISSKIFVDAAASTQVLTSYGSINPNTYSADDRVKFILPSEIANDKSEKDYIFLRYLNHIIGIMRIDFWLGGKKYDDYQTTEIRSYLESNNRIYNCGGSVVFH